MKARWTAPVLALALAACQGASPPPPAGPATDAARLRALRNAEVWHPVDPATLDVFAGPAGAPAAGSAVSCRFVVPSSPPSGRTPKFLCRFEDGEVRTVKYGTDGLGIHGEVFASRLLWLLGFYTDRVDPVRVRCRGCPEDPWAFLRSLDPSEPRPPPPQETVREFAPATVETGFGRRLAAGPDPGVAWPAILQELSPDPERAATQRAHREALTLLAAFLGHADSKPDSQTLGCHPEGGEPSRCQRPVVYVGDLGSTLGLGGPSVMNEAELQAWAELPVWSDEGPCTASFRTHRLGTLRDTPISEPARAFLAERLAAVSDAQVRALFEVAGLDGVGGELGDPDGTAHAPTLDDWVAVFEAKRAAIAERRCPAGAP